MQVIERFAQYLSRHKLKMTRERRAILDHVVSVRGHFDVDDLLVRLRKAGHGVSRATLYRNLPRLVDSGLIHKVEMDVPTRQSYVMAVVRPEERTLASGVTHLVRVGAWAVAPSFAGWFMTGWSLMTPLRGARRAARKRG